MMHSSLPLPSPIPLSTTPLISRVPKDALREILKYISDDAKLDDLFSDDLYLDFATKRESTSWLPVTHVCRSWRREAIDYPHLWNYIQIGCCAIEETKTFIERSKGVPLSVVVSSTPENVDDVKKCIIYLELHAPRIRYLLAELVCPELVDLLLPFFEKMRDVVSLRLLSFPHKAILKHPASSNHLRFLRTLHLCNVFPVPDSELHNLFVNVTNLHLQLSCFDTCPTWKEFVALIQSFPILQKLKLVDYELSVAPPAEVKENPISLLYLDSIELSLTKEACVHVLGAFDLSTVSRISVICTNYDVSDAVTVILPSHLSNTTPCTFLQTISTPESIVISSIFNITNSTQQQFNITLTLINANADEDPERTRIDGIVDEWLEAAPFKTAGYVHVSPVNN